MKKAACSIRLRRDRVGQRAAKRLAGPLTVQDGTVRMTIFVDRSSVEVLGGAGGAQTQPGTPTGQGGIGDLLGGVLGGLLGGGKR